ncbi:energy transducer TonB [Phenylobacterium immobile]|uniref:energy transducer TonB n=1 Tax=Phenylobacterium immobile TaxID=21 RepID=UPI000B0A308E|nr:energy transducer TonB [Phenylobacterium immobile]
MNALFSANTTLVHSPFDAPKPVVRPRSAIVTALAVAAAFHLGIGAYLWKARFEPQYRDYIDEVTDVVLIKPAPPPPPPAVEPPEPPPPKRLPQVQPRPPKALVPATIPPLPIPPAPRRIEVKAPPVLALPPVPKPATLPIPRPPPVIASPDWLRRPTGAEIARYYPDRAARRDISGRAVIACRVTREGGLDGCTVDAEAPAGEGFGAAALKMSRHFKMRPMTSDGEPVAGGRIRIPIRFALPD